MFQSEQRHSLFWSAMTICTLVFHNTVRSVRKQHRNALMAILSNIFQTLLMLGIFYVIYDFLGMRRNAIRGDFLMYLMSGIFVFMTHVKAMGAVSGAEGPTSPMMQHLPMSTVVSISSAALTALYIQTISISAILFGYHIIGNPVEIYDPIGMASIMVLAWLSGCAVGTIFLALKPWSPGLSGTLSTIYSRVNMFASGKFFVANTLSAKMVAVYSWNPLFHIIDQGRGDMFINYNPLKSNLHYPLMMTAILLVIGLMGESFTRKHVSLSWFAGK